MALETCVTLNMKKPKKVEAFTLEDMQLILSDPENVNVIIKFYYEGCGPCRKLEQVIDDCRTNIDLTICSVNVLEVESSDLREKFNVTSVPHLVVLNPHPNPDLTAKAEKLGSMNAKDFDAFLKESFGN